jgi:hypothetical protein
MVAIEEQTLPGCFASCVCELGYGMVSAVVVGVQQLKLAVDTGSDPRVGVVAGGNTGKAQGLGIQERECARGVVSRRNIASPNQPACKVG